MLVICISRYSNASYKRSKHQEDVPDLDVEMHGLSSEASENEEQNSSLYSNNKKPAPPSKVCF